MLATVHRKQLASIQALDEPDDGPDSGDGEEPLDEEDGEDEPAAAAAAASPAPVHEKRVAPPPPVRTDSSRLLAAAAQEIAAKKEESNNSSANATGTNSTSHADASNDVPTSKPAPPTGSASPALTKPTMLRTNTFGAPPPPARHAHHQAPPPAPSTPSFPVLPEHHETAPAPPHASPWNHTPPPAAVSTCTCTNTSSCISSTIVHYRHLTTRWPQAPSCRTAATLYKRR